MPKISVITACYNHGIYLDDAYESINLAKYVDVFEHIVVNDGSTDRFTLDKLNELESKGVVVVHQKNQGLAVARNVGIAHANGEFILPLDSDNKIIPEVFLEALKVLETNRHLDVVHTYANFFGNKLGVWNPGKFSMSRMLFENHIDACALIRRSALEKVGLYSTDMPAMGHEDWELWIKIGKQGQFQLIEKPGFYYRVLENSMVNTVSSPNVQKTLDYILKKHQTIFLEEYKKLYYNNIKYDNLIKFNEIRLSNAKKNRLRTIAKILIGRPV
ncbi:MAG: glycosyltransferase [Flavobacterium sp.]|nr:MAG: glycosyltransferase [Flavobacterium sp.]